MLLLTGKEIIKIDKQIDDNFTVKKSIPFTYTVKAWKFVTQLYVNFTEPFCIIKESNEYKNVIHIRVLLPSVVQSLFIYVCIF